MDTFIIASFILAVVGFIFMVIDIAFVDMVNGTKILRIIMTVCAVASYMLCIADICYLKQLFV